MSYPDRGPGVAPENVSDEETPANDQSSVVTALQLETQLRLLMARNIEDDERTADSD